MEVKDLSRMSREELEDLRVEVSKVISFLAEIGDSEGIRLYYDQIVREMEMRAI